MNRRSFLQAFAATASGLLLPEPQRVYSFASELRVPSITENELFGDGSDRDLIIRAGETYYLTKDGTFASISFGDDRSTLVTRGFRLRCNGICDLSRGGSIR